MIPTTITKASFEDCCKIQFFLNLSLKNPAGVKNMTKGRRTRAFTRAVRIICVEPS